jgi:hypothetical protein
MHRTLFNVRKRARSIAIAAAATSMVLGNVASVSAAQLTNASTELSDPRSDQTNVTYTFSASGFSGTTLNCITIEFNDQADGGGSVPSSMDSTSAAINVAGTLINEGSWTEDHSTNGTLELTAGGEAPAASGTLVFDAIDNGDTEGSTYFAILNTYSDVGCSTGVDSVVMAFIFTDGEPVSLTIEPTLNFTVSGVAASSAVNGATTTHLSDASGIDYLNDVTALANGVSAHDVAVTTNASGGYVVYIRHTGALTNAASDTIDNFAGGTNLSPQSFSAVGTEAWGYTTEDTTLSAVGDGVDRFTTPANQWAGFTTSNEEVMSNSAAVPSTETIRVGHQVGVASTTEAGTYTTTIVYTVVATF